MLKPLALRTIVGALLLVTATANSSEVIFTLYRNSVTDPTMRIHVATFDTTEGRNYNAENCATAADLFQRQSGVQTRFWCEPGRFSKQ